MWKKIRDSKSFYIVVSILAAILLWAYVVGRQNPTRTKTISGIPIVYQGIETLDKKDLRIVGSLPETATLSFKTTWDTAGKLDNGTTSLTVSLAGISDGGEYTLHAEPNYPGSVSKSNIIIQNDDALQIPLKVVDLLTRELPVTARFVGEVADGFQAGEYTLSPEKITIRGLKENVERIECAEIVLDRSSLQETFSGHLNVALLDSSGETVIDPEITCSSELIQMTYPISMVREIALKAQLVPGGGADAQDVDSTVFHIEPESILVSGDAGKLTALTQITLGCIDLAAVKGETPETFTFPILLPDGISNESGVGEAEVTIALTGLVSADFKCETIVFDHVPQGCTAQAVSPTLTVRVRGSRESMERFDGSGIRVSADLSDLTPEDTGRQSVPAAVTVDGRPELGGVGTYSVTLDLTAVP